MPDQPDPRDVVADPVVEVEPEMPDVPVPAADLSVEVPPEDAAEQAQPAASAPATPAQRAVPLDVDPADLAEQNREVDLGDDEYR